MPRSMERPQSNRDTVQTRATMASKAAREWFSAVGLIKKKEISTTVPYNWSSILRICREFLLYVLLSYICSFTVSRNTRVFALLYHSPVLQPDLDFAAVGLVVQNHLKGEKRVGPSSLKPYGTQFKNKK